MKEKLLIVGMGPNSIVAYEFIKRYELFDVIGFAVNRSYYNNTLVFQGKPVYCIEDLNEKFDKNTVKVFVSLFWNHLNADRKKIFLELKNKGFHFANLISPRAVICGKIADENCWIDDFASVGYNAHIGSNTFLRPYSHVGTGSSIGNHCFLATRSLIAGSCRIGDQTFVGLGCTVIDQVSVGEKCLLGAGTLIKRNMPDFSSYKTVSEVAFQQYSEETIEQKLVASKNVR